jgi:hypothetical protein
MNIDRFHNTTISNESLECGAWSAATQRVRHASNNAMPGRNVLRRRLETR